MEREEERLEGRCVFCMGWSETGKKLGGAVTEDEARKGIEKVQVECGTRGTTSVNSKLVVCLFFNFYF